jgi:uncharacterized protein YbjT (DUF2867 family)
MEDRAAMVKAAEGADAMFLMTTPFESGVEAEARQGTVAAEAAKSARVGHLLYSSVATADRETGIPHFESKYVVEKHIEDLGVPFTVIAPAAFFENLNSPWGLPDLQQGMVAAGLRPDQTQRQTGVADIASFAAHVLTNPDRFVGRRIDLASDATTGVEQAVVLSRVTGRTFRYVQQPIEQVRAYGGDDLVRMVEWMNQVGYDVDIDKLQRDYPQVGWQSFENWAAAQDWSVLDAPAPTGWT